MYIDVSIILFTLIIQWKKRIVKFYSLITTLKKTTIELAAKSNNLIKVWRNLYNQNA